MADIRSRDGVSPSHRDGDTPSREFFLIRAALLLAAGAHLAAFLCVALARVAYPYELEWVEGGVADEVLAVLHGQMPYAQPSLRLVAFIYPPLYFYLSAVVAAVLGPGYLALRLVSLAATLACFALIYALVRQGGGGRVAALLAAALFAATFKIGGTWLVLARVDALFVALFLAGAYALAAADRLADARRGRGYALAGALLALSFLTKQSTLLMAVPLAAYAVAADRRRGWLLAASFAALALAVSLGFQWASHGWYGYYVFSGALGRPYTGSVWLVFWRQNLLQPLALTVLAGLGFIAFERRAHRPLLFWLALAAGTGGAAFWVMLHAGAAENNFLPTYAALAVFGGLGVDRALNWARGLSGTRGLTVPWRAAALGVVAGLAIVQLWQLAYNPFDEVPGDSNRADGQALVQWLAQVPGDVLVPQHGLVSALAGKAPSAHLGAIEAVLDTGGPPAAQFQSDMRAALRARAFAAVVVDGTDFTRDFPELEQNYVAAERLPLDGAFYSISGPRRLPEVVYVPKR